jgi:ABC-type branched-subunit amino acid transport system ATPase component
LTLHYGALAAVDHLDMSVASGEILGLVGPNGSGKTTTLNLISGFLKPEPGSHILFSGADITGWRPDRVARRGLVRTFQEARVLPTLTVRENLLLAMQQHQEDNIFLRLVPSGRMRRLEHEAHDRAFELLEMTGLTRLMDRPASELSYGQKKLLMFAGAMMPRPRMLLLDEPAAGVNPTLIERMKELIVRVNQDEGLSIVLVEHNMSMVMSICHRVVVLDFGHKIAEGAPEIVRSDPVVIEAYFGS